MENFVMYNPVKLHFGKGVTDKIGDITAEYGKRVLLVYGKGSVKKNGSYDQVTKQLKNAGLEIIEFDGIKSNPVIEDVDAAAKLGKENNVDVIVALGGGSVIDSAKVISIAIKYEGPAWDFIEGKAKPVDATPLIAVLTLAATGTEMNATAVVQSNCAQKKAGFNTPLMFPKHSFLDPTFTQSVPRDYTAYGILDLIAHALENWFGQGESSLTDRFIVSIIKDAMKHGPNLLEDLNNYDLRARIMFAATCALNGMTGWGKKSGDWGVHVIGHCLSVAYDVPHGASLSIVYPAWLKLHKNRIPERINKLGTALFGTSDVDDAIYKLEYLFKVLECPISLKEIDLNIKRNGVYEKLLDVMQKNKVNGQVYKLTEEDYPKLLELMA
jgi:alcohol dehydrogenase YqhD (iron-dependent ADH family)